MVPNWLSEAAPTADCHIQPCSYCTWVLKPRPIEKKVPKIKFPPIYREMKDNSKNTSLKIGRKGLFEKRPLFSLFLMSRVAEVVRRHGGPPPKSLEPDKKFKPEHVLFCRELWFVAILALYKAFFLNPNIRYFVVILRFVAIYVLYKASFRWDSDKRQLSFVQTQTKDNFFSSRLRRKTAAFCQDSDKRQLPFIKTQTKDSFLTSRLRRKTSSFCSDTDERQLPFVKTQTKDNFFLSRLRRKTGSLPPNSANRQLPFI